MGENFDPYYKWLGIPPKDQPPHHYRLLGIEVFEKDREVIDAAANRLMGYLKDLAVGDEGAYSQNLLNEIARARICLLNKKKKSEYDRQLRSQLVSEEDRKPAVKGPPPKAAKRTVPPPAAPPSAAVPSGSPPAPPVPNPSAPIVSAPIVSAPTLPPEENRTTASPDDAIKIVAMPDKQARPTVQTPLNLFVQQDGGNKVRRPPVDASPARVRRHGRDVYVAATLIAIVGGVGLILIIVMSFLLLSAESGSGGSAAVTPETASPPTIVFEMSDADRDAVTEFVLNDAPQPLPLKDEYVLEEGRHRIVLKRPGYEDFYDSVTLADSEHRPIRPQWIRAASP